jgi:membrane peptidoglycan carboxypeptidase
MGLLDIAADKRCNARLMAKRLRSYVRTAAIVAAAAVAFAALLFLPPVDRALGGLFARSADGATVARYPEQLRGELARHERGYVDYADIPATLEQALISVEDKRFLQHGGIDPIALVRALAQDAQNDHVDHGGATIPLQLARMILQIPRRQPSAIAELTSQLRVMHAALIVEHDFSKQKILELYLNGVYLGHGATGVAAAAEAYFHVPVGQLNEAQCIYMAGLPNNPGRFGADPSGDAAMARYRHVIATMVHNGYLTVPKAAALNRARLFGAR